MTNQQHAALRSTSALAALLMAASLFGCANWPPEATRPEAEVRCDAGVTPADNTRLAAISQMVNEGKLYAALAQLDTLNEQAPKVQLTRADALRRVERHAEARGLFEGLIAMGCFKGRAHHGLGLLLSRQGALDSGLDHLRSARKELPTDARVRSDLGYALLLTGKLDDARFELMTALDLDPQDTRAGRNLVLLTLKQGDSTKAQDLGNKLGLDKATMDRLQKQASELAQPALTDSTPAQAIKAAP